MSVEQKKTKLFSLNANLELAEEISRAAKIPLSKVEVTSFSDGETSINIEESVRGHHCFVIQPTSAPVNENIFKVLIMADALKRASAKSITMIMPYYGYSRQDRKAKSRQPITAKLVADLLQVAGVNRVICIDLHASQIQGFFDIPIDNFPAAPTLAKYFLRKKINDIVVVSPDHGGATRARVFARIFDAPLAIVDKRRPRPNEAEVMNIIGDVMNKNVIILDDIIDTAGTITVGAKALKQAGAKDIYVAATHAVFSGDAIEKIEKSEITKVIVTNTIALKETSHKVEQLSIGNLLGEAVLHLVNDEAISQLFERINDTEI